MDIIRSSQNHQIKLYRSLGKRKYRDELNLLPLEGCRLIEDALQRGINPEFILLKAGTSKDDFPGIKAQMTDTTVLTVEEKLFDRTAFTDSPQGILAIVKKPAAVLETVFTQEAAFVLVVDRVQDPGNLGTMLRSAAAAGAGGALLLPGSVDPTNPKALRASMGAFFALPVIETDFAGLVDILRMRKISLVMADADAALPYDQFDWTSPVAVVIGNEGSGVSDEVKAASDISVAIPMSKKVESLNAAVAMSILFFEAARQRRMMK